MAFQFGITIEVFDDYSGKLRKIKREFRGFQQAAKKGTDAAAKSMARLNKRIQTLNTRTAKLRTGFVGLAAAGAALALPVRSTLEYGKALAEVGTILADADVQLPLVDKAAKELAVTFGQSPTAVVKAFYQTVSAGAADAAEATSIMKDAGILAVGGLTDIETAVDGLTSVLNAYELDTARATDVSDIFFTTVRLGKIRVEELASGIGKIVPIAATLGVGMDQLGGAIALSTKSGITASEAMTGLRSTLAAVLKPSEDAIQVAKDLEINFSRAGLEAMGLSGFMAHLVEKTKDHEGAFERLIPQVEALPVALTLAKNSGADFLAVMEEMKNAGGAAKEAYDRIAATPAFKLEQLAAKTKLASIEIGEKLIPLMSALVPVLGSMAQGLSALVTEYPNLTKVTLGLAAATIGLNLLFKISALAFIAPIKGVLKMIKGYKNLRVWLQNSTKAQKLWTFTVTVSRAIASGFTIVLGGLKTGMIAMVTALKASRLGMAAAAVATGIWNAVLLANPVVLIVMAIIVAIALLAAAAFLVITNWDKVSAFFVQLWENWKKSFTGFFDFFIIGINKIIELSNRFLGTDFKKFRTFAEARISTAVDTSALQEAAARIERGEITQLEAMRSLGIQNPQRVEGNISSTITIQAEPNTRVTGTDTRTSGVSDGLDLGVNVAEAI